MGVPNQIRTGTCANAIANTGTVAKVRAIGGAEGVAGLGDGNAGDLPTAEKFVLHSTALEKRQGIDVADSKVMALIEIRAAAIGSSVVGIHERTVKAVGGIVNGMAIGVGEAQGEVAQSAPC